LVAGRDKLGGILIETVRNEGKTAAVIGIGINFVLPKEVEHAASVQALFHNAQLARGTASVHCIPASTLLDKLLGELNAVLTQYAQNGFSPFLEEYQTAHRDHGKPVLLLRDGQTVSEGTVLSVDAQGALHLITATGEQTVVSGEISLRPDDTPKAATPRARIALRRHRHARHQAHPQGNRATAGAGLKRPLIHEAFPGSGSSGVRSDGGPGKPA